MPESDYTNEDFYVRLESDYDSFQDIIDWDETIPLSAAQRVQLRILLGRAAILDKDIFNHLVAKTHQLGYRIIENNWFSEIPESDEAYPMILDEYMPLFSLQAMER